MIFLTGNLRLKVESEAKPSFCYVGVDSLMSNIDITKRRSDDPKL